MVPATPPTKEKSSLHTGQNRRLEVFSAAAASASGNGAPPKSFDYDLIIIRAGVGGHGAAWHAVEKVTFIEALDQLMLGFDPAISKLTQRILINPRKIDYHTGVFASKITPAKDGKPVIIELIDARTKELKDKLEVDAALITTGRAPFTNGLSLENEIEQPSGLTQHLEVR